MREGVVAERAEVGTDAAHLLVTHEDPSCEAFETEGFVDDLLDRLASRH